MQYLGYSYAKILFTVYLKPEFKGAFCILSSNLLHSEFACGGNTMLLPSDV